MSTGGQAASGTRGTFWCPRLSYAPGTFGEDDFGLTRAGQGGVECGLASAAASASTTAEGPETAALHCDFRER